MRELLFVLLAAFFGWADASPVTLNFQAVPLTSFAQATFQSMMGADFVMSPDVVALDKKITLNIKSVDSDMLGPFLTSILGREGIKVTLQGGIYFLDLERSTAEQQGGSENAITSIASSSSPLDLSSLVSPRGMVQAGRGPDIKALMPPKPVEPNEAAIYVPVNRPADLIVEAINAAFGPKAAQASGDRVMLSLPEAKVRKAFALLEQIDFKPATVEVSASWVEVTHQTGGGLGVSIAASVLGQKFAASLGTTNSGSALSLTGTNFSLVLDALNSDSRIKQVSNSRMLGDAGEKIMFTVGDSTPTISSTSTNMAGNPVQNVVYQASGVITNVTANVLGSGKIHLTIDGEISSFQPTTTGVTGSPTLIKRQLKTVVTTQDGEVLLIGGLNSSNTTTSNTGWAFLPSSWTSKADSGIQTDLVLVLSARVTDRAAEAVKIAPAGVDRG